MYESVYFVTLTEVPDATHVCVEINPCVFSEASSPRGMHKITAFGLHEYYKKKKILHKLKLSIHVKILMSRRKTNQVIKDLKEATVLLP